MNRNLTKEKDKGITSFEKTVLLNSNSSYSFPIAYFPGWKVKVDGKITDPTYDMNGLLSVPVPQGKHTLEAYLALTQVQSLGTFISLLSFASILLLCFREKLSRIYYRL
jgi:uncharacterized membrane protein YfhO